MARRTPNMHSGLFDTLQHYVHNYVSTNEFMRKIHGGMMICVLLYAAGGLVSGFICKHYGRYLCVLLFFMGILFTLDHLGLVSIAVRYAKLGTLLGVRIGSTQDHWVTLLSAAAKTHVVEMVGFLVGFIVGIFFG